MYDVNSEQSPHLERDGKLSDSLNSKHTSDLQNISIPDVSACSPSFRLRQGLEWWPMFGQKEGGQ